jgi:hypothetical protein
MDNWCSRLFVKSVRLSADELEQMCLTGHVLEQDERGIKVVRLASGDILKLFRVKRLISGANLYSYARRFCRNAERLHQLGIPTVTIKQLYQLDHNEAAVLYQPIEGHTIRQIASDGQFDITLAERLGIFLAELHQKGVHFHSLHTGNIVVTPFGTLGLIDISDLTIYPWALFCNTRARSFKRLCRYPEDIQKLGLAFWQTLQQHYFQSSQLGQRCELKIKNTILRIGLF